MKIRCLVLLVIFSFFVMTLAQFCIPQMPLAYAQSEEDEEEEEPMQTRPDPTQNYIRGKADKTSMQKGIRASRKLKTTANQAVSIEGVEGESMPIDPYGAQVGTEGVLMPPDPFDAQAEVDSMTGASMATGDGVGSASWDPSESPAGWDPFDKETNLDSAEMHQ